MDNSNNKTAKYLLSKDIFASDVYTLGYDKNSYAKLDYTKRIITKDQNKKGMIKVKCHLKKLT